MFAWPWKAERKPRLSKAAISLMVKSNIKLISKKRAEKLIGTIPIARDLAYAITEEEEGVFSSKFIYIDADNTNPEIAAWHELGHLNHPLGQSGRNLTSELAANAWALKNYPGDRQDIIPILKGWIMTYINYGFTEAQDMEELKETAKVLGIFNRVTWR